ncbi:MAG: ferredoxin family protein [Eubacteriales bacterium]|nr:ferredoxin family protein [Eubacteriales bacterium]
MSIHIDQNTCIGCGQCAEVCPGTLIQMKQSKAWMRYPKECWGCVSCVKQCPVHAVSLYLGADIGGAGSRMTVTKEGSLLHWTVTRADASQETITVDSRDANKY